MAAHVDPAAITEAWKDLVTARVAFILGPPQDEQELDTSLLTKSHPLVRYTHAAARMTWLVRWIGDSESYDRPLDDETRDALVRGLEGLRDASQTMRNSAYMLELAAWSAAINELRRQDATGEPASVEAWTDHADTTLAQEWAAIASTWIPQAENPKEEH